jgi:hypothetical protein
MGQIESSNTANGDSGSVFLHSETIAINFAISSASAPSGAAGAVYINATGAFTVGPSNIVRAGEDESDGDVKIYVTGEINHQGKIEQGGGASVGRIEIASGEPITSSGHIGQLYFDKCIILDMIAALKVIPPIFDRDESSNLGFYLCS